MGHDEIHIEPYDDVYLKIDCERGMAKEISEFFTFTVPNHQYTPAFKNKLWDGQIRLFNLYKQTIYCGLSDYIIQFAKDRNYKILTPPTKENNISSNDVVSFLTHLKIPYTPHEHQVEAIRVAVNKNRCLLLSPTGSGKSLMIYSLVRYYLDTIPKDKKILIIVPTTGLVSQMNSDFQEYSKDTDWDSGKNCHTIFAGQDKETNKRVVISTWQSIYKMDEKYFNQYHAVFGDEVHLFKAKSLTGIMTKLKDCPFRIGTTGTLDDSITHKLVIEGLFGRVCNITSTKELMEKNLLSNLSIDCITLKYKLDEINEIKRVKYDEEIKWILNNSRRNKFIVDLSCKIKGNTLILFNYVKDHGIPLFESIQETCKDKKVFLIHGKTEVNQREEIRSILEKEKNAILVASYGTCSTGINIKNINNIVFASPSRSVIRVLQSIGRGLRKTDTKDKVKLYDISDDLRYKKYVNHTYRHLQERLQIYDREKFEHSSILIKL
ncbi:MAG: DEAD/DEAH box helicase family protein [Proteobacteria bacterium]|nr:DEAD/DEAH box helicase family protein [Pseudomonadota bacterium]